jgi:hypothetical protein
MSKLEVDAVEPQSGTSLTLGASGDTITIPSGAIISNQGTATGFGPTGAVSWDVANIKTTGFTAVNGLGYFCNTTSTAFTVTLPASPSAGSVVGISDYAGTFGTNNLTINPNGLKIGGLTSNAVLTNNGIAVTLIYVDSIQGWIVTDSGDRNDAPQQYSVDFLVIAGGGSGGAGDVTGANYLNGNSGSNSSISGSGLTTITSAGGGYGATYNGSSFAGGNGGSGGGGGSPAGAGGTGNTPSTSPNQGNNGGSGNSSSPAFFGGGGGGAGAVGVNATTSAAGNGGNGTASSITGTSVTRAGGGGGCKRDDRAGTHGTGGTGGGGNGGNPGVNGTTNTGSGGGGGDNGGAGSGGGASGGYRTSTQSVNIGTVYTVTVGDGGAAVGGGAGGLSGAGGKGVVILSMPDANYSGTTTGSPTVATGVSGKTVLTFNGSGSYTG